ncbi:uncharacterized protein LOC129723891 [Wyeomyia smithii]|uniref:uncharacterized protein LOC129723891 n=1 Tax=Wyeomyia smithii TaxID=174621 RepID=UPI0024680604|nr:uncharacterized protein LOC129723891 [Wyeomyia smithii]
MHEMEFVDTCFSDPGEELETNGDVFAYTDSGKTQAASSSRRSVDKRAHINRDNWNDELVAALIAQVELHPIIWDVTSPNFRNKNLKDSAWEKVRTDGNLTSIADAECRRKWQHLCNNNNKLANAYYNAKSDESARRTPNWLHWPAMEFVRQNRASYRTSTESNLEVADSLSVLQKFNNGGRAKRVKRPVRIIPSAPTATGEVLKRLDTIMETIGAGKTNPNLDAAKEWTVVLNQMSPMYAARAKSEIKAVLSKYWSLSVAAEVEEAENQYQSELAKTNK